MEQTHSINFVRLSLSGRASDNAFVNCLPLFVTYALSFVIKQQTVLSYGCLIV